VKKDKVTSNHSINKNNVSESVLAKKQRGRKPGMGEQFLDVHRGKAYHFLRSCPWDVWWDEFSQTTKPDGRLLYPTCWSFAKAKSNTSEQQRWIYAAIGPEPLQEDGHKQPSIMWLGNWVERRARGFWFGTASADALKRVLKERGDALEAARGVAAVSVEWQRRVLGLSNQVDNFFAGQMFSPDLSFKENRQRALLYITIQERLFAISSKAGNDYLRCHGIHRDDLSLLAQTTAMVAQNQTPSSDSEQFSLPERVTLTHLMVAQTVVRKAQLFNFDPPGLDFGPSKREEKRIQEVVSSFPADKFPQLQAVCSDYFEGTMPDSMDETREKLTTFVRTRSPAELDELIAELDTFICMNAGERPDTKAKVVTQRLNCACEISDLNILANLLAWLRCYRLQFDYVAPN